MLEPRPAPMKGTSDMGRNIALLILTILSPHGVSAVGTVETGNCRCLWT